MSTKFTISDMYLIYSVMCAVFKSFPESEFELVEALTAKVEEANKLIDDFVDWEDTVDVFVYGHFSYDECPPIQMLCKELLDGEVEPAVRRFLKATKLPLKAPSLPAPVREPLERGTTYYVPVISLHGASTIQKYWTGDFVDTIILNNGLVHRTQAEALAHAEYLISLTRTKS